MEFIQDTPPQDTPPGRPRGSQPGLAPHPEPALYPSASCFDVLPLGFSRLTFAQPSTRHGILPAPHLAPGPTLRTTRPQVLLERELAKLSAELDKDLRAIETGQPSSKVPAPRGPPGGRRNPEPRRHGFGARGRPTRGIASSCTRDFGRLHPSLLPKVRAITVPSDP